MSRKIVQIPAKTNTWSNEDKDVQTIKRRVAAYARVSTDSDEQESSYITQMEYYKNYINRRSDWDLVDIYSDEGITGTSTKKREGFNKMLEDALNGKIDLIITKSVSRFARNTVDSLTAIRELKDHNVECYFEKENIWTFDGSGELLLTIMSSLAQEESRSISENVKWGCRKKMERGEFTVAYSTFLGYDKDEKDNLKINEEEAKIVRDIYKWFLSGLSTRAIAKKLTAEHIPTPMGNEVWCKATIQNILTNEKYKGDAILQKVYVKDFLTKKQVKNNGELPQYYIQGGHEAIISPEQFDAVQVELGKRAKSHGCSNSGINIYTSKIKCGDCGKYYGPKTWHANTKNEKIMYQCNAKYTNEEKCSTPNITIPQIQEIFLKALSSFVEDKDEIVDNLRITISTLFDSTELEIEREIVQDEITALNEKIDNFLSSNTTGAIDTNEFQAKYDTMVAELDRKKKSFDRICSKISGITTKAQSIKFLISTIESDDCCADEFREDVFGCLLDHITIYSKDNVVVTFKSGEEITVTY